MEFNVLTIILVLIVAFLAGLEGILDQFQFHQPIIACSLIGLATGHVTECIRCLRCFGRDRSGRLGNVSFSWGVLCPSNCWCGSKQQGTPKRQQARKPVRGCSIFS